MAEAQPDHFNIESGHEHRHFHPEGGTPVLGGVQHARRTEETTALLTLREATKLFGVNKQTIYRLVELGLIDPPGQIGGKGRAYYSERQVRRALTRPYSLRAAA